MDSFGSVVSTFISYTMDWDSNYDWRKDSSTTQKWLHFGTNLHHNLALAEVGALQVLRIYIIITNNLIVITFIICTLPDLQIALQKRPHKWLHSFSGPRHY